MLFMNGWDGMGVPSAQLFGLSGRFSALRAGFWVIMHIFLVVAHLSDVDREDPPDLQQLLTIGDIKERNLDNAQKNAFFSSGDRPFGCL